MSKCKWSVGKTLRTLEEEVIKKAMDHFEGNKTQVAASLGVSVRTIDNKISLYKRQDEARSNSKSSRL